jgi:hypothetical protein
MRQRIDTAKKSPADTPRGAMINTNLIFDHDLATRVGGHVDGSGVHWSHFHQ